MPDGERERRQASRGSKAPGKSTPVRPDAGCPFCRGTDTVLQSAFGSTLGFAQYWCRSCRTVFEYLKWEADEGDTEP